MRRLQVFNTSFAFVIIRLSYFLLPRVCSAYRQPQTYGVIRTTVKHAIKLRIKLKTSPGPARLAQLLQPSLAFCCKLQPINDGVPDGYNL